MEINDLIILSIALAADATAVGICKSINIKKGIFLGAFIIALYFGAFQSIMPIIGYYVSSKFTMFLYRYSSLLSFLTLSYIGIKMIKERKEKEDYSSSLNYKIMIPLAIATSIDALVTGLTFALYKTSIIKASLIIGLITFIIVFITSLISNRLTIKYNDKAKMMGGILLIIIGIKMLLT